MELAERNSWWEGPSYLKEKPSEWPINKITHVSASDTEVRRSNKCQLDTSDRRDRTMVVIEGNEESRLEPKRFSSWLRLTRIQAWIYRSLNNYLPPRGRRTKDELTVEEIQDAEIRIIKAAQKRSFEAEYSVLSSGKSLPMSSKLLALKPRLDEDGVMRSDGRLENAEYLPYDVKYPIILPRKEWVRKLIVRWYHQQGNHSAGTNQTLAMLSSRFWLMQGREEIRECEGECYECRRRKAKAAQHVMAPLPKIDTFETMPVECGIESLDGRINMKITAFTANRVTGNMKAVNWARYAKDWNHLKDIKFPYLGPRPIVDILIGIDYADLHYSIKDVRGKPGDPVARLTPLGWTCVGHPSLCPKPNYRTNFIRTYFVHEESSVGLGNAVRKFWEIEDDGLQVKTKMLKPEDQVALEALKKSIKFEDGRYEIGVPWKEEKPLMPDNYETALRRLQNTEKRLCRYPEIGKCYSDMINQYEAKGYITKVPENEKNPANHGIYPTLLSLGQKKKRQRRESCLMRPLRATGFL